MVDLHLITATEFKTNNLHFSNAKFFVLHDVLVYYRNHSLSVSLCVYLSVCLSLFTLFHLWPSKRGRRENTLQVHTSVVRVFFFPLRMGEVLHLTEMECASLDSVVYPAVNQPDPQQDVFSFSVLVRRWEDRLLVT